jgi:hypothetical protein
VRRDSRKLRGVRVRLGLGLAVRRLKSCMGDLKGFKEPTWS